MTPEEITSHLRGVRRTARGFMARCPAHDDRHPSLSIADGDGKVLIRCWAGCKTEEVMAAIGLHLRDLFYTNQQNGVPSGQRRAGVLLRHAIEERQRKIDEVVG